jgi:uncharacterized protein (TIGR02996 family)
MTQHDALLAAVCAAPDDDLPRLVYADWLDENGDADRAEFIRTQITIANGAKGAKLANLQKREAELLAHHWAAWTDDLAGFTDNHFEPPFDFRRGFVEAISIDGESLRELGTRLFRAAPIRTLRMGDEESLNNLRGCKHLLRVVTLDLTGSGLGDRYFRSAKFFGSKMLANLTTLIARGMDDNGHLDRDALLAIIGSKHLTKLSRLDIGGNWLYSLRTDEERKEMTDCILCLGHNRPLTELVMDGIGIGDWVVRLAAEPWLERLKILDLDSNNISDAGARALAESTYLEHIERLNLLDNIVHDDGETTLSPAVKRLLKRRFGERVQV